MSDQEHPNVLLIFTDQHRLSAVGAYGDTVCQTPNIDRLAEEGALFETAYTTCPLCSPARGTIMTGQYPHSNGVCSNVHNLGCSVHELSDRPGLLSRRLEAQGYRCGYSGKWHLGTEKETAFGSDIKPSLPKDVGFEGQNFPGHGGGGFDYPEYKEYLVKRGYEHNVRRSRKTDVELYGRLSGVLTGPVESTVPHFLAENSIDMMERFSEAGDRFFVWHNFWGPHIPYYCTEEFYDLYADVEIPEWPTYRWNAREIEGPHQLKIHPLADEASWEDWAEIVRCYYGFTSMIDYEIGRMLDYLDESGLSENTVVIFTADHGQTLGSHGGLTDKGWSHFEEIQRIPFIVRMPEGQGGIEAGARMSEWVSLADVYPTVLELAGIEREDAERQGRSVVPLLKGEPVSWRDSIFVEFHGLGSMNASLVTVREGDIKYGWNCVGRDELYDLETDPHQMHNVIDDPRYGDRLIRMRELIEDWMLETDYPGVQAYRASCLQRFSLKGWED